MNRLKIMCMKTEHFIFLDSVSFLPFPLGNLPEAYGLTTSKSWCTNDFNTEGNLDYVCPIRDVTCHGVNEMGEEERSEILAWYDSPKSELFDNRRVLEKYSQNDVTVLREAYRILGTSLCTQ